MSNIRLCVFVHTYLYRLWTLYVADAFSFPPPSETFFHSFSSFKDMSINHIYQSMAFMISAGDNLFSVHNPVPLFPLLLSEEKMTDVKLYNDSDIFAISKLLTYRQKCRYESKFLWLHLAVHSVIYWLFWRWDWLEFIVPFDLFVCIVLEWYKPVKSSILAFSNGIYF